MSLLTLCQDVADEVGFTRPSYIIGNNDATARQLLTIANKEGFVLSEAINWHELLTEYTFQTTAGVEFYVIPSDYSRHIDETLWDRANYWKLRGPMSPQQWQLYKSGIISAGIRKRFRIKAGLFYVDPVPSVNGETLVYEYISKNWVRPEGAGPNKEKFTVDTDSPRINERLIQIGMKWRFLKAKGIDYAEEKLEYDTMFAKIASNNGGKPIIDMGGQPFDRFTPNIPETGFGP